MTKISDFEVGDRVRHSSMGDGEVTEINEDGLHVTYDRTDAKKLTTIGIYPEHWFEIAQASIAKI